MQVLLAGLLLVLGGALAAPAQEVPYSAVVMDLTGKAAVTRHGESRPLETGTVLFPGDLVETAADAFLTVYYPQSGEEEKWPGGLKFTVGKLQSDHRRPEVKCRNLKVVLPSMDAPPGGMKIRGAPSPKEAPQPSR